MSLVVLDFRGNTTGLNEIIDVMEQLIATNGDVARQWQATSAKISAAEKENTAGAKSFGKAVSEASAGLSQIDKVVVGAQAKKAFEDLGKQLQLTGNELKKFYQRMADNARQKILAGGTVEDIKKFEAELTAANSLLKMFEDAEKRTAAGSVSLKTQLRGLVAQLAQLEAQGKRNTAEYSELLAKAGEIKDAIGDANEAISNSGSDTRQLDNLVNTAGAVAGAFTIATGATALFGIENEDIQEVIAKTNAAMAILNGLQQIQDFLSKRQFTTLAALLGIRRAGVATQVAETEATAANTAATTASTVSTEGLVVAEAEQTAAAAAAATATEGLAVAQTEQAVATTTATTATGGATLATRAWNAVLNANPLFLLIGIITAAAAAIHIFSDNTDDATESQKRFNNAVDEGIKLNDSFIGAIGNAGRETIAELESQGASRKKIRDKELYFLGEQVKEAKTFLDKNEAAYQANEERLRLIKDKRVKADADEITERYKTHETYLAQQKKVADLESDYRVKTYNNVTATNEEIAAADKESRDKANALAKEQQKKRADQAEERIKEQKAADKELKKLQDENYLSEFASDVQRAREKAVLDFKNEKERIEGLKISEKTRSALLEELRQKEYNELAAIDRKAAAEEAKAALEVATGRAAALEKAQKEALDTLERLDAERQAKAKKKIEDDKKLLDARLAAIKDSLSFLQQGLGDVLGDSAVSRLISGIDSIGFAAVDVFERIKAGSITSIEGIQELAKQGLQVGLQVANQLFAEAQAQRQADLEQTIATIATARQQELDNENLTKQQKADIQARYDIKEKAAKTKAYEEDKKAKIAQAAINGALAITNIFATVPKFDFGISTFILAGVAAATTLAQIALIKSQPVPKFRHGKIGIEGPGTTTSDSIPAWISRGESVINAEATAKHTDLLEAINNDRLEQYYARLPQVVPIPASTMQRIRESDGNAGGGGMTDANMRKIAGYIAAEMKGTIPGQTVINIDMSEDKLRLFMRKGNELTEYQNKRYRFD